MSEKLQYVGWGLVGTPKGRQQTADGVDKQLNLAPSFDLEQQFGGCLPEPKIGDLTPLYRLSFQQAGQYPVLGVAEYRPIYEQGQTRAGSYFGAFVEAVHHAFDPSQSELLKNVLLALSSYQTTHFIDAANHCYTESLNGKHFEAPQAPLLQLAEQMTPLTGSLLTQTASEETLYIACEPQQAVETLQLLLQQQLYYRFKQIFFSESRHISQQMQGKKIPILSASQLQAGAFYLSGWETEVRYLRGSINQAQATEKQLAAQLKQEREQQNQLVATQLKQKMGEVEQQIALYKQQAENAEIRAAKYECAAEFGRQIYQLISEHDPHLRQGSNLHQQASQARNVITKTSTWTYLFGGLSVLFGLILLVMLVISGISDDKTISETEYNEWQKAKTERSHKQAELDNKEDKITELSKQLEEAREKFSKVDNRLQKICKDVKLDKKSELCEN